MKQTKNKKAQLNMIVWMIIAFLVIVVVLSVFFGIKGSGLFGRVGKSTDEVLSLGPINIRGGTIDKVDIEVSKELDDDFKKVVDAFGASKDDFDCYIKFGTLNGLKSAKDQGFSISLLQTESGTRISLQKQEKNAIVEVRGKNAEIEQVLPCIVLSDDGKVAENFHRKYSKGEFLSPEEYFYTDLSELIINSDGTASPGKGKLDLSFSGNIFVKPREDRTCLITIGELWGTGNEGFSKNEVDSMASGEYPKLKECSGSDITSVEVEDES